MWTLLPHPTVYTSLCCTTSTTVWCCVGTAASLSHADVQVEPAEFILELRPAVVVFENSFSAAGGNGAVVSCTESAGLDGSEMVTMACAFAERMRMSPGPVFQHVWQVQAVACLVVPKTAESMNSVMLLLALQF